MMRLSGEVVVLVIYWGYCVSGSRPCPVNCKMIQNSTLPTCNIDSRICPRGCRAGYYGNTCNMNCDDNCQGKTCQQRDGSCTCKPGYTFNIGSCEPRPGVKCRSNDHCLNNMCLTAYRQDCLEGCKSGWFGKFCLQSCSPVCVCDKESGYCTNCISGWYGEECGYHCNPACMNKNCHRNGTCVDGCTIGSYGERCELKCSPHCVSGCDQLSGECVQCEAGRYGSTCQCSAGCAGVNTDCDRDGRCSEGCTKGYYGERCESRCPDQCHEDMCDLNGTCSTCKPGYYGTVCGQKCQRCTEGVCEMITGECTKGCQRDYFGSLCSQKCVDCKDQDCDRNTGKCKEEKGDMWSGVQYWVGGSVAVVIIIAAVLVYIVCRMKRMHGVIYDVVKWRRRPPSAVQAAIPGVEHAAIPGVEHAAIPGVEQYASPGVNPAYAEVDDEVTVTPPKVCLRPIRQTSYIRPRHSGDSTDNLQIQPQAAAASPPDRRLHDVLRRSDEWSDRPDSYVLPNYCEINEDLMVPLPQPTQGAEGPAPVVNHSSFSVVADVHVQVEHPDDGNATGGDINIPLIAECFRNTETEDSTSDEEPRPDVENYDHPFRDDYEQS